MKNQLDCNELALWSQFLAELTGISLNEEKEYLIRERFHCLLEKYHCSNFSQLYFLARLPESSALREELIDRITTKETSFFRDLAPFEALRNTIFPKLLTRCRESGEKRQMKIWSAACSTGQEVYSLAMILHEMGVSPSDYHITGTDISRMAIDIAKSGFYNRFEVERGVSPTQLHRFFQAGTNNWQIKEFLRKSITFQQISLHRPFIFPERFDLIICRNIAIYFIPESRNELFEKIHRNILSDGYLLLGSTESAGDSSRLFKEVRIDSRSVFFQPNFV